MKETLRVGIIGCGTMGRYAADFLADGKLPGCEPAAVLIRSSGSHGREHL